MVRRLLQSKRMRKGQFQISFAWIFAIIIGVFILSLTIFGVSKFIKTEKVSQDTQAGKEIETMLNPLESGYETGQMVYISMPTESKIYNNCYSDGTFGKQGIQVSQKSIGKSGEKGVEITSYNKYIFSEEVERGEDFYVFSKPFYFPFKIADLIYFTSSEDKYCFEDADEDIKEELESLGQPNIFTENCSDEKFIEICFEKDNCEIVVNYLGGYLIKDKEIMYFNDDVLMFAAIFSNEETYNCQLQRLMKRTAVLSEIYSEKSNILLDRCVTNLESDLILLKNSALSLKDSSQIHSLSLTSEDLEKSNKNNWGCELW